MALEIVWTRRAIAGYDRIIDYMEKKWGEKKITDFIRQSHKFFNLLSVHPEILQKTENQKNVYRMKERNKSSCSTSDLQNRNH